MTSHMDTAAAAATTTTTTRNGDDTRGCVSDDRASPQCVAGKNGGSAVSIYRTSSRSPTPPPASDSLSNLHRVTDMLKDKLNGTANNNNNNATTTGSATPSTPTTSLDLSAENGGGSGKRKAYSGSGSKQVNGCSGSYNSNNNNNGTGNGRTTPTSTSTATTGATTNNNKMDAFSMAAAAAAAAAAAQQQMSMLLNNDLYGTDSNVLRGILQGNDRMLDGDAKLAASGKLYSDLYKNHMTGSESGDSFRSPSPGNASFDSDQANGDLTDNRDDEDSTMTSLPRDDGYLDDESTNNAKRLRVDGTNGGSDGNSGGVLSVPNPTGMSTLTERRPKRKQYIPQQHGCLEPSQKVSRLDRQLLQKQLRQMQQQLSLMQQRYCELFEQGDTSDLSDGDSTGRPDTPEGNRLTSDLDYDVIKSASRSMTSEFGCKTSSDDIDSLAKVLKAEITHRVGSLVDAVVAQFVQKQQQQHQQQQQHEQQQKQSQQQEQKGFRRTPSPTPSAVKAIKDRPPSVEETSASSKPHGTNTNNNNNSGGGNNNNNNVAKEGMPPGGGVGKLSESCGSAKPPRTKVTDKLSHPLFDFHQKPFGDLLRAHPALFPPPPYFPAQIPPIQPLYAKEPEQTEALALVVGTPTKKKRTKVTDTRLSPRAARALLQENMAHGGPAAGAGGPYDGSKHGPHAPHLGHHGSDPFQPPPPHPHPPLIPISLPTSVAIPNPSLQHSDILAMYSSHNGDSPFVDGGSARRAHSPSCSGSPNLGHTPIEALHHQLKAECDSYDHMMQESYGYDGSMAVTSTLTPMHLRKAKLMFFYTRYPSSSILKIYFPDVKFNKNNTAQLVKWFSNFREFYYIQMEKYARQALAEGVKNAEDLVVTTDSELYRILNLHYNRNNQIEVPDAFRVVVQATLREFFRSIQAGKDAEQSWKKAIYKVIARMDDTLPEYFKSPNWMEQLNDG